MCHGESVAAFPEPAQGEPFADEVAGLRFGQDDGEGRIAILPDIYGTTPFYRQIATRYAQKGAQVWLIDPFADFGPLPEQTRDAAFARRHKLADRAFIDAFERFAIREEITAILGFCLGGLYVFELSRRDFAAALVGLYGFPQGMDNRDPLPVPFDYLPDLTRRFTMLMPGQDASVGPENIARLAEMSPDCPAMDLTVYPEVGHGFLPGITSDDPAERAPAEDALRRMDAALLGEAVKGGDARHG